ncbi:hypothetical protein WN51_00856 [Melipona quadrifasciata]|uniref:Uncharacterized protein n=1 Tax=Melipona quadrifasciata TaxID=166423 RepID=A0A0N0BKQ4_9HYME|nr:hypothetical protein WN51_00856 [Melipona quadrifasciata]
MNLFFTLTSLMEILRFNRRWQVHVSSFYITFLSRIHITLQIFSPPFAICYARPKKKKRNGVKNFNLLFLQNQNHNSHECGSILQDKGLNVLKSPVSAELLLSAP